MLVRTLEGVLLNVQMGSADTIKVMEQNDGSYCVVWNRDITSTPSILYIICTHPCNEVLEEVVYGFFEAVGNLEKNFNIEEAIRNAEIDRSDEIGFEGYL